MAWRPAPALTAILQDANRVAPNRSHASDGTIGDATHSAETSDHNPDPRGVVHACDVTNDPPHGMDTWYWANVVAQRIISGKERRVKYLVSNDGTHDKIFNPSVSYTWRNNNAEGGQSHRNHLHVSILYTTTAENDISRFFVAPGANNTEAEAPPIPVQEAPELSNVVYYGLDKADHQFYVQGGAVIHRFGNGSARENLSQGRTALQADIKQPVTAKIRPDTFGTVIDVYAVSVDSVPIHFVYKPYQWSAE